MLPDDAEMETTDPEAPAPTLHELMARVGSAWGFDAPVSVSTTNPVFRCRCGDLVKVRGTYCAKCSSAEFEELRQMALRRARKTLPDWPHARLDSRVIDPRLRRMAETWIKTPLEAVLAKAVGMLVLGPSGLGKSTLVVAAAIDRFERARTAQQVRLAAGIRYVTAQELDRADARHPRGAGDPPLERTAKLATVLIIDDLGKEHTSGAGIRGVLEERYGRRPTLMTSELTLAQLGERYGISDRRRMAERVILASTYGDR